MMTTLIVAAFLSGSPTAAPQPQPQPPQQPQPPASRPPAEQIPAPTPTPTEPGTPGAQAVNTNASELDRSTATALLDRIEAIVNDALQDESSKDKKDKDKESKAVGTSGKLEDKAGKLTIDRSALDEILAEVGLLKTMIRK